MSKIVNEKIKIHNENQYEIIQSEKLDEEYRAKLVTSQTMENLNKIEYKMTNFNRVEIIK